MLTVRGDHCDLTLAMQPSTQVIVDSNRVELKSIRLEELLEQVREIAQEEVYDDIDWSRIDKIAMKDYLDG